MPSSTELRRLERDWASAGYQAGGWPQFLTSVKVEGLRGWQGEQIEFRFPIVAIAGENGSGKSTVLKVAASAYANVEDGQDQYAKTFNPTTFSRRRSGRRSLVCVSHTTSGVAINN